jgi:hypothetical protein
MLKDFFCAPSLTKRLRSPGDRPKRKGILPLSIALGAALLAGCSGGGGSVAPASVASQTVVPTQAPTVAPSATPTAQSTPTTTGLYLEADSPNHITYVQTTLTVPAEPPATGSLLVSPALAPVNNLNSSGVIAPVLTWGPSCAPGHQPTAYSTWWVSPQYDTGGDEVNDTGCQSGPFMPVNAGDLLVMTMALQVPFWYENIMDVQSGLTAEYQVPSTNYMYNRLSFLIQGNGQNLVSSVPFSNTSISFASPPANG